LTTNPDPSGTPDEFSLAILDNGGVELPTNSAAIFGTSVILLADLIGDQTQLFTFGSAPGASLTFPAPLAAPSQGAVPEPATLMMIISGLIAGVCLRVSATTRSRRVSSSDPMTCCEQEAGRRNRR
jgi:PEP-CTERM motif